MSIEQNKTTETRIWRWLRLGAFVLAVVAASAWWKVRQVSAEFNEHTFALGRQLASWNDPRAGTSTIQLNGQRLEITSVSNEAGVATILNRFSEQCARSSGGVTEQLEQLGRQGQKLPEFVGRGRFGVFRAEHGADEGVAACFARADAGDGLSDLFRRLQRLVDSGDFAALGQLRYVFARRRTGSETTHVITVTSLSALPLLQMFPERGDVPGPDLFDGVRPALAKRVLSAALEDTKQQIVMYESDVSAKAALASYDAALITRGFSAGDLAPLHDMLPVPVSVYIKQNEIALLVAEDRNDGHSLVSAFRLADGGFVRMTP